MATGKGKTMRISDDRYSRDRLRLDLALRFIHHEARTHTIRAWTGLTDDRIRKLYRTYLYEAGGTRVARHRGKSPRQAAFFTRSLRMRREAAVFASVSSLFGLITPQSISFDRSRAAGADGGARRPALRGLRGLPRAGGRAADLLRTRGVPARRAGFRRRAARRALPRLHRRPGDRPARVADAGVQRLRRCAPARGTGAGAGTARPPSRRGGW